MAAAPGLSRRVLIPLLACVALWIAAALGLLVDTARERAGVDANLAIQHQRERLVLQLRTHHNRTLYRLRAIVFDDEEPRTHALALATPMARQYREVAAGLLTSLTNRINEPETTTKNIDNPTGGTELRTAIRRVRQSTLEVSAAIDDVIGGATAADAETMRLQLAELSRAEAAFNQSLGLAVGMSRRMWERGSLRAGTFYLGKAPGFGLIGLLLFSVAAAFFAHRPLSALSRLAANPNLKHANDSASHPQSGVEARLAGTLSALETSNAASERQIDDLQLQRARIQQISRRAEHELALSRIYVDNLVNSLRSAVVVTNTGNRIISFNRVSRELLGLSNDCLGAPISELGWARGIAGNQGDQSPTLKSTLEGSEGVTLHGVPLAPAGATEDGPTAARGGEKIVDITVAPYLDEGGQGRGLLWIVDDVTDATGMKHRLLNAERLAAVGRLAAQVAHEIRNPLSAIGLNTELVAEEVDALMPASSRAESLSLLRATETEIERLTQITEGYLQLARAPRPAFGPLPLNESIRDLITMLRPELRNQGIGLKLNLSDPGPTLWGDAGQIRQALLNILRNAQQAVGTGGAIEIETRLEDGRGVIEICDNGPGIPDSDRERVFEPFFTGRQSGSGLGLTLTREIVVDHGGTIELLQNPPTGTRVELRLPLRGPQQLHER